MSGALAVRLNYCVDVIAFRGHPNVTAKHETTLEVTKDEYLSPRGDCIVGVRSNRGASELNDCVKQTLKGGGTLLAVIVSESGFFDHLVAEGSEAMTFSDDRRVILRRSSYVCGSTIGVRASKAANDLSRELVEALRRGERGYLILVALRR